MAFPQHHAERLRETLRRGWSGWLCVIVLAGGAHAISAADHPERGSASGPAVTVTNQGGGLVTMANGDVAILLDTKIGRLNSITYTHRNNGTPRTSETLKGKGQFWYGGFRLGDTANGYVSTLAVDPAKNNGDYADIMLVSDSPDHGVMELHFSMRRGSHGFYTTGIHRHRRQDVAYEVGAWGFLSRVPLNFQWVSLDAKRNLSLGAMGSQRGMRVPNSPHEILVLLDGAEQGEFDDKFIYAMDNSERQAWGWCSVGKDGLNVGAWLMNNQMEFSNGGPLKRDVATSHDHGLNNPILTGEVGMGSDGYLADGEIWTKTCGPCFYYVNDVPAAITDPKEAARQLRLDALRQAAEEAKAWPYSWFKHPDYVPAAGRGTVTGTLVIQDGGNPDAPAAGAWVGLEQQPKTIKAIYDFQKYFKAYQYWVQTDANGSFTIPNVIAGGNYTMWAYGPGAIGTFMSQPQTGGNPPLLYNLPAKPFSVAVTAGTTTTLGTVTWTPTRVGATVFELGIPNRKADEFRHGEDYWAPARSPKLGYPTPVWGGQVYFPLDFPTGMTFNVGKDRWATDWNYVLPSAPDAAGIYQPCSGTIAFDLALKPADDALASLYLACAGDAGGKISISINDSELREGPGVSASPNGLKPTGFDPPYQDDASIHFSDHGPFSDQRITFPGRLLRAGRNTLTILMNARSGVAYLMVDHLRLELAGYIPPAPAQVIAYAGNQRNMVSWSLVPGAISYTVLRATSRDPALVPIATGVIGPICGNDANLMTYVDTTASNGTTYRYRIQTVNADGASPASTPTADVTPSSTLASGAPSTPTGVVVTQADHRRVMVRWASSPEANFYRISRTTLHYDGVGGTYGLRTITLADAVTEGTFTDLTPTDGSWYRYHVQAVNAAGSSAAADTAPAQPLPTPPAAAPQSLTAAWTKTRQGPAITLSWAAVPGATGYVIYRSIGGKKTFAWPDAFLTTLVETTYLDQGDTDKKAKVQGLEPSADYAYQVTAVNAAGISPPAMVSLARRP